MGAPFQVRYLPGGENIVRHTCRSPSADILKFVIGCWSTLQNPRNLALRRPLIFGPSSRNPARAYTIGAAALASSTAPLLPAGRGIFTPLLRSTRSNSQCAHNLLCVPTLQCPESADKPRLGQKAQFARINFKGITASSCPLIPLHWQWNEGVHSTKIDMRNEGTASPSDRHVTCGQSRTSQPPHLS